MASAKLRVREPVRAGKQANFPRPTRNKLLQRAAPAVSWRVAGHGGSAAGAVMLKPEIELAVERAVKNYARLLRETLSKQPGFFGTLGYICHVQNGTPKKGEPQTIGSDLL